MSNLIPQQAFQVCRPKLMYFTKRSSNNNEDPKTLMISRPPRLCWSAGPRAVSCDPAELIEPDPWEDTIPDCLWQPQFKCRDLTRWNAPLLPSHPPAVPGVLPPLTHLTPSRKTLIRPRVWTCWRAFSGCPSSCSYATICTSLPKRCWQASSPVLG